MQACIHLRSGELAMTQVVKQHDNKGEADCDISHFGRLATQVSRAALFSMVPREARALCQASGEGRQTCM